MFMRFAKGAKRFFAAGAVAAVASALLDLVNPRIIGYTVDYVIGNVDGPYVPFLRENLWAIALVVVLIALLAFAMRFVFRFCTQKGTERFVKTMRDSLYSHIIRLPYSWHNEHSTGDIIQRCTSDVDTIKAFLSEQLIVLFRILVVVSLSITFMSAVDLRLTGIAAIYIPVVVTYSLFFHTKIAKLFENVDIQEGKLSAITQENLTGVRVVRAFGRERYETERFVAQNKVFTDADIHMCRYYSAFWASGDLFMGLQALSVLYFGCVFTVTGQLTAGNLIEFVTYNAMMVWPVRMLGRVIADMSKARVSIKRIRYIMDAKEETDGEEEGTADMRGDIEFNNVTFSYDTEVLHDISFKVRGGTTLGILGGTGSGKSTLMELLCRLYELPEENGSITIGGKDIRKVERSYLRKNIGMVLQEPYLFSGTIAGNIAITGDSNDMEQIERVSRIAALKETIEGFKHGYETRVGERGVTLSGGQKQRTAIAQMLLKHAPVMIFDDSLSAVDSDTDRKIRAALKDETKDATIFLISHRVTTLMHADKIIVMDKGRIAEEGTHAELMELNGLYRRVYDLQSIKE